MRSFETKSLNRYFSATATTTTTQYNKLGYFRYHLEKSKVGWKSNPDSNDFRDWYEQNKNEQHERTNNFIRTAFCVSGGFVGVYLSWKWTEDRYGTIEANIVDGMFAGLTGMTIGGVLGYKNHYTLPVLGSIAAFVCVYGYALNQRQIMKELKIKEWQQQKKDSWIKEYKNLDRKDLEQWKDIEEFLECKQNREKYWNNGGEKLYSSHNTHYYDDDD